MSKPELTWSHNADERRWELGYTDPQRFMYEDPRVVLSWITEEAVRVLPRDRVEQLALRRYGMPLPDEAFDQAASLP